MLLLFPELISKDAVRPDPDVNMLFGLVVDVFRAGAGLGGGGGWASTVQALDRTNMP